MVDISKINLGKDGLCSFVSEIESEILEVLWGSGKADSRLIHEKLKASEGVAHSTVAVYLDRLHSKGLVERKVETGRGGLHYIYSPKYRKDELGNKIADSFLVFLKKNFGEQSTAYLRKNLSK